MRFEDLSGRHWSQYEDDRGQVYYVNEDTLASAGSPNMPPSTDLSTLDTLMMCSLRCSS